MKQVTALAALLATVGGGLGGFGGADVHATPVAASHDARAKSYFETGRSLGARGRYGEALAEFSAGYELSRRPLFLFNMAECARALGDDTRAREHYERFVREVPTGDLADVARKRLAALPPAPVAPDLVRPTPPRTLTGLAPGDVAAGASVPPVQVQLAAMPAREARDDGGSVWRSPWLWAGAGAVLLTGSIVLYAATRPGDEMPCGAGCVDLR